MNDLLGVMQQPCVQRLGWTLLHFLWQGVVLAVLFALLRSILANASANTRYWAGCITLLLMAVAPVVTFMHIPPAPAGQLASFAPTDGPAWVSGPTPPPDAFEAQNGVGAVLFAFIEQSTELAKPAVPWLVAVWLAGVFFLSLRLITAWLHVRRLQTKYTEPLDAPWRDRLVELERRLGLSRAVRLLKSAWVEVPTVVGWLRPVILLPVASLSGLSSLQLELVLAHELAHVRRYDHWINLFQILVETLLFYHPAVWWVSGCIRADREQCCDDLAVAACGNRVAYARALASLEELRSLPVPLALGANTGPLLQRIRHVLGLAPSTAPAYWQRSVGSAALGVGLIAMAVGFALLAFSSRQHEAAIRIAFDGGGTAVLGTEDPLSSTKGHDPYFIQTEVERMKSGLVAGIVAEQLGLVNKWGQRPTWTDPLRLEEVVWLLKQRIDIRQVRGTTLIEIRVLSQDRTEAKDIADALVVAYLNKRSSLRTENARRGIAKLKEQWRTQDEKVKTYQTAVDRLREELQVPDLFAEGPGGLTIDSEVIRNKESRRTAALEEYVSQNATLTMLIGLSRDELRNALPVQFSDSQLLELMQRKAAAEQELAATLKEKTENHPDAQRLKTLLAQINAQIEGRLDGIMLGLRAKVASAKAKWDKLEEDLKTAQEADIQKFAKYRPYFQAKLDLETQRKLRDVLSLKIAQEEIDAEVNRTPVEIVDQSLRVVYPGREFALCLIAFGLLSSLSALVLSVTSRSRHLATTAT
jgi:uncharacterized protein involved in exopolysaccharide biosynthesis